MGTGRAAAEPPARSLQWWIGDWWAYGEHRYGERTQAIHELDLDLTVETCQNYAFVARKFKTSRRREVLSFGHHQEVAALPPEEADALLDWCKATTGRSRSIRELREEKQCRVEEKQRPNNRVGGNNDPKEQRDEEETVAKEADGSEPASSMPSEIKNIAQRVEASARGACEAAERAKADFVEIKCKLNGHSNLVEDELREMLASVRAAVSAWNGIAKALVKALASRPPADTAKMEHAA